MKRVILFISLILGSTPISIGQNFSTLGEIYNFEVGDEFQIFSRDISMNYGNNDTVYYLTRNVITSKSSIADSLVYVQNTDIFTCDFSQALPVILDTILLSHPENLVFPVPDSVIFVPNSSDTVYWNQDSYNGRKICVNTWSQPNSYTSMFFVDGCGLAKERYFNTLTGMDCDSLFYFKKGNEEWGQKVLNSISEPKIQETIYLFPNPVGDELTIKYLESNFKIQNVFLLNNLGASVPMRIINYGNEKMQID
jgi:hypothetical protein